MPNVSVLILAAGKGTRMKSSFPKVLHPVAGTPMLHRVLSTVRALRVKETAVVIGCGAEKVQEETRPLFPKARFFVQRYQDGSGGAVRAARGWLKKQSGLVLLVCGDAPLLTTRTFKELIRTHQEESNDGTVLTTRLPNPAGYGRIIRTRRGSVARIVEELDAQPKEKEIQEVNTGSYCFNASVLSKVLPKITNKNAKKEYYITDALELILGLGGRVGAALTTDADSALGINSRADLAKAQAVAFRRKAATLMEQGVTIVDPSSVYIEEGVQVGPDTVIWPQTYLHGSTRIGQGCEIGPMVCAVDSQIKNQVKITASFLQSALIENKVKVGPFSRVRPGTRMEAGSMLGNFSEIKNSSIGSGSKINHLSYLGDAKVGKNVNIGAGAITCNYDGVRKHPTVIQDHVFVGSNANLIAPIKLGANSVIGAGSTLSEDVSAGALAFERAALKVKKGWGRKRQRKGKKK